MLHTKLIGIFLIAAATACSASSFGVDKTCIIGSKVTRFEYVVDSNVPDAPAKVTMNGVEYTGVVDGDTVYAVMPGTMLAKFEFNGDIVTYSMVGLSKNYWLGEGLCK